MKHQDNRFKTQRTKAMETITQNNGEIRKELDKYYKTKVEIDFSKDR